jgi:hypothetical protein
VLLETTAKTKSKKKAKVEVSAVDPITETAFFVENLIKGDAYLLVPTLLDNINFDYFKLGGVLSVIRDNKWWQQDYGAEMPFNKFLELKFGLHYRKAMYLIQIYNDLLASGVKWEQVHDVGWTKLKEISSILSTENVDEWVAAARELTTIELAEKVAKYKMGKLETSGLVPVETAEKVTESMSFKVHKDQKDTIQMAIVKAKSEADTEYDAVALEAICLNYLSGGKTTKPKSLKSILEAYSPKEVLDAFELVWPGITVEVSVASEADLGG